MMFSTNPPPCTQCERPCEAVFAPICENCYAINSLKVLHCVPQYVRDRAKLAVNIKHGLEGRPSPLKGRKVTHRRGPKRLPPPVETL